MKAKIDSLETLEGFLSATDEPILLAEGTRRVRDGDWEMIVGMGELLATRFPDVTFRTGNATGADEAFAEGVGRVDPTRIEYVLPSPSSGKSRRVAGASAFSLADLPAVADNAIGDYTVEVTPDASRLVKAAQGELPNARLAAKGRYLLRDTLKVLGEPGLGLRPATAGVFYVYEDDPLRGGTGHTVRVCIQHEVPVVFQRVWKSWQTVIR